jgi:hypothetical protein
MGRVWMGLAAIAALSACERYDEVDLPLPPIPAHRVDGTPLGPGALAGKPWVVNLWVPG